MDKPKRSRRRLPALSSGATLESSSNGLEDSCESVGAPSEEWSTTVVDEVATTIPTKEWKVVIIHPTQTTFTCPVCGASYHVYASLQQHVRDCHKDRKVTWVYVCSECREEFQDKKKVSAHVTRMHAGKLVKKDTKTGTLKCEYCEETFQ